MRYIKLYLYFFIQNLKAKLEYRIDFIIGIIATIMIQATGFAFISIVFTKIPNINGWSMYEVALIYGLAGAGRGITEFFFDSVWYLSWDYIREGKLDHILHRPISPLFHIMADRVETHGLGNFCGGFAIVIISLIKLKVPFSAVNIIFIPLVMFSGGLIHFAINLFLSSIAFRLIDLRHLLDTADAFSLLGKYPVTIYPQFLKNIITFILPFAFVGFFPAAFLLNKTMYGFIGAFSPIVALTAVLLAVGFFNYNLKYYESSGS